MSIPIKHHYLPVFYLSRWAHNGQVYRYVRPCGKDGDLDCQKKPPSAIASEENLYQLPTVEDPKQSQHLELGFFQQIDDGAARVITGIDQLQPQQQSDMKKLCQFIVSLLHRSPNRIKLFKNELATITSNNLNGDFNPESSQDLLKSVSNKTLQRLITSEEVISVLLKFKVFKVDVKSSSKKLITGDQPIVISGAIQNENAFVIMPYAPDHCLLLVRRIEVAAVFYALNKSDFVKKVNKVIAEQSSHIMVAYNKEASEMIDRSFMRSESKLDEFGWSRLLLPRPEKMQPLRPPIWGNDWGNGFFLWN